MLVKYGDEWQEEKKEAKNNIARHTERNTATWTAWVHVPSGISFSIHIWVLFIIVKAPEVTSTSSAI